MALPGIRIEAERAPCADRDGMLPVRVVLKRVVHHAARYGVELMIGEGVKLLHGLSPLLLAGSSAIHGRSVTEAKTAVRDVDHWGFASQRPAGNRAYPAHAPNKRSNGRARSRAASSATCAFLAVAGIACRTTHCGADARRRAALSNAIFFAEIAFAALC